MYLQNILEEANVLCDLQYEFAVALCELESLLSNCAQFSPFFSSSLHQNDSHTKFMEINQFIIKIQNSFKLLHSIELNQMSSSDDKLNEQETTKLVRNFSLKEPTNLIAWLENAPNRVRQQLLSFIATLKSHEEGQNDDMGERGSNLLQFEKSDRKSKEDDKEDEDDEDEDNILDNTFSELEASEKNLSDSFGFDKSTGKFNEDISNADNRSYILGNIIIS